MLTRIHRRLGTAGFAIAIVALIAALGGTALAASGALTGKQKKEVEKIAKKYAGKPGAPGAVGPVGAAGKDGANGTNGTNGTSADGISFTGEKTVGSVTCKEGGVEVQSAKPATVVCNGKNGTTGFTETLPSGKTLKGEWSVSGTAAGSEALADSVSFGIPLSEAPTKHYLRKNGEEVVLNGSTIEEEPSTVCLGTAGEPEAAPGSLCVYAAQEENSKTSFAGLIPAPGVCSLDAEGQGNCLSNGWHATEASPYGFGVTALSNEAGAINVYGSWAVTAE